MTTLLSEEQLMLRESARDFLENEVPLTWVREWTEAEPGVQADLSKGLWQQLAEMGWLGLLWPEEFGGAEMSFVEQAIVLEELGRALLPSPYLSSLISACIYDRAADDATRSEALKAVCAGERVLSFAISEEGGDHPEDFAVRATPGDAPLLSGSKLFVPDAPLADELLVVARGEDGRLSWYRVAAGAAKLEIESMETMDATRPLYRVSFSDTPATLLGTEGNFASVWQQVEPVYWAALAAEAVGGSQRVLEDTVAYAKEREQFGAPIGVNQVIKHKCSNLLIQVEGARAVTYHAVRELAKGAGEATLAASMAKCYASEAYRAVAEEGIQIHGGVGFTWEYDIHYFYKHARAIEVTAGHPDEHRERVAAGAGL
jgi:alkylation response protein AidB-like acyl-CoA dehydrogenase